LTTKLFVKNKLITTGTYSHTINFARCIVTGEGQR
jgi:hypothetical protein